MNDSEALIFKSSNICSVVGQMYISGFQPRVRVPQKVRDKSEGISWCKIKVLNMI